MVPVGQIQPQKKGPVTRVKARTHTGRLMKKKLSVYTVPIRLMPWKVLRIMPNTPLLVGQGMSAIALGRHAHMGDEVLAMGIFQSAGEAVLLGEELLDAVTAVSGSGPAYLFYLAEAMAEAARDLGLKGKLPEVLTRQTLLGAAQLLCDSDASAAELRRRVTSPGGTTEAAITHMDKSKMKAVVGNAIRKAEQRSRELGK